MTTTMAIPDLNAYWMPVTPNQQFRATPRMVVSAQGIAYRSVDGREVLDSISGLQCVGACRRHPHGSAALKAHIDTLNCVSSF